MASESTCGSGNAGRRSSHRPARIVNRAVREGANPKIAVDAREGRNMRRLETRVEGREPPAVEYQESLAFCTEQDPPRAQYQHRGDDSQTRIDWEYLAKARAIERQQSLASRGDEELRLGRSGGDSHGHRARFGGRQFDACAVPALEWAASGVQEEPGPRAHHDPILIGDRKSVGEGER